MKKRNIIFIIVAVLVVVITAVTLVACDDINDEIARRNAQLKTIAHDTIGASGYYSESDTVTTDSSGNFVVEIVIEGITYDVTISKDHEVLSVKINDRKVDKDNIPASPFDESQNTEYIGKNSAKEIALTHIGASEDTYAKVEFDFDDGTYLYEVEFIFDNHEYEYDINAITGEIHKIDKDRISEKLPIHSNTDTTYKSAEQAKEAALAHAQVSSDDVEKWSKVEFEYDRGTYVYEVEFRTTLAEYEYEINATTGAIISHEVDYISTGDNNNSDTQGLISKEEAQTHAFNHAGITNPSAIMLMIVELDFEYNKRVYKMEFIIDRYVYEYEIDAVTGNVLSAEKELIS